VAVKWTVTQRQRLRELNVPREFEEKEFPTTQERDKNFLDIIKKFVENDKKALKTIKNTTRKPKLLILQEKMAYTLIKNDFLQVVTPIIIPKNYLTRMSINNSTHLFDQVFWVSDNKCLRPMLAPNLYVLLRRFVKIYEKPIRIFEIGPCFRKDSKGRSHLQEFTMLNLVELGLPENNREDRIKELIHIVMDAAGIKNYLLVPKKSDVYGDTIDVMYNNIEVASGVIGPHHLDKNWGIINPWVGIGFGLERLLMIKENFNNIQRAGRSLIYYDGFRLNIQ